MGCQTQYSPPITIPTSITVVTGTPGASGNDGTTILYNTSDAVVTSNGTGGETLTSYTIAGGTLSQGDIVEIEAYFTYPLTFVGDASLSVGGVDAGSFSVVGQYAGPTNIYMDNLIAPNGLVSDACTKLKSTIFITGTTTQKYHTDVIHLGNNNIVERNILNSMSLNIANPITIDVKITSNTLYGLITCDYFLVKYNKSA